MRAGRALRDQWHADKLSAEKCPRCGDTMGEHRGMPADCTACDCHISFADLAQWRAEGKLSR